MKLTQAELIALAKLVGVDAQVVEDSNESEYDSNAALQAIDGTRSKILQPKWEQEHSERLESQVNGKLGNIIERALIKELGVDKSVFQDGMKDSDKIRAAAAAFKSNLEGDQASIDKKFTEMLEKHNAEREQLSAEYEGKLKAANDRYVEKEIFEYYQNETSKFPLSERTDKVAATRNFVNHLQSKYHIGYDEAKKIAGLYDKNNPKAMALNAAGNNLVDIMEEAKSYFTPLGIWETDTRNKQYDPNKGQGYTPSQQPNNTGRGAGSLDDVNKGISAVLQQAGLTT